MKLPQCLGKMVSLILTVKTKDKAEQLEQMAKRLHFISQGLEHAAVCPAENHMECPTFQKF